jgi:hypothetical protein
MCTDCKNFPSLIENGSIECNYKTAARFAANFAALSVFALAMFYAPALIATDVWSDACGYGVQNDYFGAGYYLQTNCK